MALPTVADFKTHFFRDFPYGTTLDTVIDADINKALNEALANFNLGLFGSDATRNLAYLYLTAHYLVTDLRNSSQGISGQYSWLQASKGVGAVNEAFNIPQKILDNPYLAMLSKTNYGAKYLSIVLPLLTGQIFTVCGGTQP